MKKSLLALVLLFFFACQPKEDSVDYVVISGKISNLNNKEISLTAINGEYTKHIPLKDNGTFRDTLKSFAAVPYRLGDGNNYIDVYLEKGYDLYVTYDAGDFKNTLNFEGIGAPINNYLQEKVKKTQEIWGNDAAKNYSLNETDFKNKMEGMGTILKDVLEDVTNIPEDLKEKERRNIDYERLIMYSSYADGAHAELGNKPDYKASSEFTKELASLDYTNEEDFNYSRWYRSLARRHYANQATKLAKKDSTDYYIAFLKTMKDISSDDIRNALLFNGVKYSLSHAENIDAFYNQFMELSSHAAHKKEITETYEKLKKITPGALSPEFIDYENHSGGTTSLSDFRGKYMYIDVWATWCQPCIAEIPALEKIEKLYHDENIAFVSISIDRKKDYDKWRKMVSEKSLGGVQLIAENAWESSFVQDYQIMGIPRFILVDPEGKIVDAKAPSPSNAQLKAILDKLKL